MAYRDCPDEPDWSDILYGTDAERQAFLDGFRCQKAETEDPCPEC